MAVLPAPVPLDDEAIAIMSKKTGLTIEDLKSRSLTVPPDVLAKVKKGDIQFQSRTITGEEAKGLQERQGPQVLSPGDAGLQQDIRDKAFETPQVRDVLEQRYALSVRQADLMAQTAKLPASATGRPVNPADALGIDNDKKPVHSVFTEEHPRLKCRVLSIRPSGAPSILQECKTPIKLFISQHQSPGDIVMLTRAIDDLHKTYPGKFITCMRTPANDLWASNPNHTPLEAKDSDAMWMACEYKLVNTSNRGAHHFVHGFRKDLESKLGIPIDQSHPWGALYLSDEEKTWFSQIYELQGKNVPFWIIDAGRKNDYTAKHWEFARFQEVVDRTPHITWVQIGSMSKGHFHPELKGDNVVNLLGKTTMRQLVRLVYHSAGVLTPVSLPMHLAAAVEMHPRYRRHSRPCIVIAGGREPAIWEAYTTHDYIHNCGQLPCCSHGGCWKSRVEPLGDGDRKDYENLCEYPVATESGQVIPKCLEMISVDRVLASIDSYMMQYDYSADDDAAWTAKWPVQKPGEIEDAIGVARRKSNKQPPSPEQSPEKRPMDDKPAPVAKKAAETEHAPPENEVPETEQASAETPEVTDTPELPALPESKEVEK